MESKDVDKQLQYAALNIIDSRGYKGEAQGLDHQILIRILSVALLFAVRNRDGFEDGQNTYRKTQSLLMNGKGSMRRNRARKYVKYIKKRYDDVIDAVKNDEDMPNDLAEVAEL
jgi:hypothetical protein